MWTYELLARAAHRSSRLALMKHRGSSVRQAVHAAERKVVVGAREADPLQAVLVEGHVILVLDDRDPRLGGGHEVRLVGHVGSQWSRALTHNEAFA